MKQLAIAMPLEGPPETAKCHYAVQVALRRLGNVLRLDDCQPGPHLAGNVDVSRARDRLARAFLFETSASHMLWWDEDVLPDDLGVIQRMLDADFPVVGCPYRRKSDRESYPYQSIGVDGERVRVEVVNGCVEVDALAFGFMVTSREALDAMWRAYRDDRWHIDVIGQNAYETVGMFDLRYSPARPGPDGGQFRTKLSEDYSWCQSYREIGGTVRMYVGPGSPVAHIGSHVYRGSSEGLVRT